MDDKTRPLGSYALYFVHLVLGFKLCTGAVKYLTQLKSLAVQSGGARLYTHTHTRIHRASLFDIGARGAGGGGLLQEHLQLAEGHPGLAHGCVPRDGFSEFLAPNSVYL